VRVCMCMPAFSGVHELDSEDRLFEDRLSAELLSELLDQDKDPDVVAATAPSSEIDPYTGHRCCSHPHTRTHACTHSRTTHTCMHTRTQAHTHTRKRDRAHTHTCTHIYTDTGGTHNHTFHFHTLFCQSACDHTLTLLHAGCVHSRTTSSALLQRRNPPL
jgi:hypothetical protein